MYISIDIYYLSFNALVNSPSVSYLPISICKLEELPMNTRSLRTINNLPLAQPVYSEPRKIGLKKSPDRNQQGAIPCCRRIIPRGMYPDESPIR
jgi:hypothetical protein